MSKRTHTSSWRQAFAHGPVVGAVVIAGVFVQGNPEVFVTHWVYFVFVPLCVLGLWFAWRLGHVLSDTPSEPVHDLCER